MDRNKEEQESQEKNARAIIARIREESGREAAQIIERARQEAEKAVGDAESEAERMRVQLLGEARQELEKIRERIFSGVNLEKKRVVLQEKNNFIQQVLQAVRETARQFRAKPGYDDFLRRAAAEGALVVGAPELEVFYSPPDEKLFLAGPFIRELETLCRETLKKTVTIRCTKGDFNEPGVIVASVDGRIQFDNRFSSRLARFEDSIYAGLLKGF